MRVHISLATAVAIQIVMALLILSCGAVPGKAEETLCAEVKIEILQELTLERQAFDARMRINNALDTLDLQDVEIAIEFREQSSAAVATTDPSNLQASFFIRRDQQQNVELVEAGTGEPVWSGGTIAPSTAAEVRWLIIPAPGAAGGLLEGKTYEVGARVRYRLGGEQQEIVVAPDFITVRPQPQLQLDYFLTKEVRANDPLTPAVEPSEPFTLGVRVLNNGNGLARNVAIDSAQPKIVENNQGLLISFEITGSYLGDVPTQPTLQLGFGDIGPRLAKVGRWVMHTTLAGRFTEFSARFTHADELGGRLTSLITSANAHFLIKDVLVDLPGRDRVRDFLAFNEGEVATALKRVYESDTVDAVVSDQSDASSLSLLRSTTDGKVYRLTAPVTAGMFYVRIADPEGGQLTVRRVVRADGKVLAPENGWSSAAGLGDETEHFVNLFDANGGGSYEVEFGPRSSEPVPPAAVCVPARSTTEGTGQIGFILEATDPNGDAVSWSAGPLPIGAAFVDQGEGDAYFQWFPAVGQAGVYPVSLRASDGVLSTTCAALLTVNPRDDSDGDGMSDAWEIAHFGDLSRLGTGDSDGDGTSDFDEFLNGTDPTIPDGGPPAPVIAEPRWDNEVQSVRPSLHVRRPSGAASFPNAVYEFEVFDESNIDLPVSAAAGVPEGITLTSWSVGAELVENHAYVWRVRSTDATAVVSSSWVYGRFGVNQQNEAPSPPEVSYPADGDVVDLVAPRLQVTNATDPDGDSQSYGFVVSSDPAGQEVVASAGGVKPGPDGSVGWVVNPPLQDGQSYFWRAIATDEHGASTASASASLMVSLANRAPTAPLALSPTRDTDVGTRAVDLRVQNASDPELESLAIEAQLDTRPTFDGPGRLVFGPVPQTPLATVFSAAGLEDDTTYFWRARAFDGERHGPWRVASFRVNTENDAPLTPVPENPADGAALEILAPRLELLGAEDMDGDELSYEWEIYEDRALTIHSSSGASTSPSWYVSPPLRFDQIYYWRARSMDTEGLYSPWSIVSAFTLQDDEIADPPFIEFERPDQNLVVRNETVRIHWSDADPDSNASITLLANGVPIAEFLEEDGDRELDSFEWDVTDLPPGSYQLSARISDGLVTSSSNGCCTVTVMPPAAACSDGVDNDGDGDVDSSSDSGCVGADDPSELLGDLDGDGDVDGADQAILTAAFGSVSGSPGFVIDADLDRDGVIGFPDVQAWKAAETAFMIAALAPRDQPAEVPSLTRGGQLLLYLVLFAAGARHIRARGPRRASSNARRTPWRVRLGRGGSRRPGCAAHKQSPC